METINPGAMQLLIKAFPQAQSWEATFEQSPTLVSLLNTFALLGTSPRIQPGTPGAGSSASGSVITIDPNELPNSGIPGSVGVFATLLGHELGHATQQSGEPDFTGITDYEQAVSQGLQAEGIAAYWEYQVALQEGVTMYSDSGIPGLQAAITWAVQNDTPDTPQYAADAIAAAGQAFSTAFASPTRYVTTPTANNTDGYATYTQVLCSTIPGWPGRICRQSDKLVGRRCYQ